MSQAQQESVVVSADIGADLRGRSPPELVVASRRHNPCGVN